jgi:two-component sensor histidine kinase
MATIRLSRRLLLLMFAAMSPVVIVLFYNLYALQQARQREIRDDVFQTGQLAALEIQRILSGMEGILYTPSVAEFETTRCGAFLANTTARIPGVFTLGVIGLDGLVKCRQDQKGLGTSLADRPYFKDALRTGGFVAGEYTKSRITGKALLPLAAPLRDAKGNIIGVVAMSVDLDWLQRILTGRKFDTGAELTLADRNGVILAHYPEPERFVGTRIPDQYQNLVKASAPGTIQMTGQDGTPRLLAYFPPGTFPKGLYLSTGLSVEHGFYFIRRATTFGVAATVFAVVGSLLLAWQTNRFAIQKPVQRILNALDAWRSNRSEIRTAMSSGDELGTIGAAMDEFMDELLVARRQRELLEGEMSHRIKNVLALVQAVAQQTFRGKAPTSEVLGTYGKRLAAIGDSFELLGRDQKSARLMELVTTTVAPFEEPGRPQFTISGEDLQISPKPALAIAMALHELCTNAVKYGALRNPEGRVIIRWVTAGTELVFRWEEQDGPAVVPPEKTGFGSQMMEKALTLETGGAVNVDYSPTGLKYALRAPLDRLVSDEQLRDREN